MPVFVRAAYPSSTVLTSSQQPPTSRATHGSRMTVRLGGEPLEGLEGLHCIRALLSSPTAFDECKLSTKACASCARNLQVEPRLRQLAGAFPSAYSVHVPGDCLVIRGGGDPPPPPMIWLTHPPTHLPGVGLRRGAGGGGVTEQLSKKNSTLQSVHGP